MRVEITPDHLAQRHWFEFEIDQSYVPATVAQLESVLGPVPRQGHKMAEVVSLEGPVEIIDGELAILIPLKPAGLRWRPSRGVGEIDGEFLKVVIQPWLAEKLRIDAGSLVIIDNANGKFTITRSPANDEPTH